MSARLFVGAISGTSVDGLDLAVLAAGTPPSIVAGRTAPIPPDLTRLLKDLGSGAVTGLDSLGEADHRVGTLIGTSIIELLSELSLDVQDIVAVGSHGQTVRHRSDGATPFSLQIGDPNLIAEITGIDTVADFRRRDMAVGGQGAPLVPPFHEALFRTPNENRTVLNIGGIANISLLPADAASSNHRLRHGTRQCADRCVGRTSSRSGIRQRRRMGAHRQHRQRIAEAIASRPIFSGSLRRRAPVRSSSISRGSRRTQQTTSSDPADIQSTLAEITAATVEQSIRQWAPATSTVVVCGGGA